MREDINGKEAWPKEKPEIYYFMFLLVQLFEGLFILFCAIWLVIDLFTYNYTLVWIIIALFLFLFLFTVSTLLISSGYCIFNMYYSKIEFTKHGIYIKYPFIKEKTCLAWDEFQQVCVCYTNYSTTAEPTALKVICLVKKGEKKNAYGRWKADNPFRYKTVITKDYTPELHKEAVENCPYEVVDLRNTPAYKLTKMY